MPTPPASPALSSASTGALATGAAHLQAGQTATSTSAHQPESKLPHPAQALRSAKRLPASLKGSVASLKESVKKRLPASLEESAASLEESAASLKESAKKKENKNFPLLDELPVGVLWNVVDVLQKEEPKAIGKLASTSRSMYFKVAGSGKILRNALCFQSKNAWKHEGTASEVLEDVVVRANAKDSHLTSEDRLAILHSIRAPYVNLKTAEGMIEMVEGLDPVHQCQVIPKCSLLLRLQYADTVNRDFYDRLAKLAKSAQTDEDKAAGLSLLPKIAFFPAEQRTILFDELAAIWETIEDEGERTESFHWICTGISRLHDSGDADEPHLTTLAERMGKYADQATSSIKGSDNKLSTLGLLSLQIYGPRIQDRWNIFCKLVKLADSIPDANIKQEARSLLRSKIFALPESEQQNARNLLDAVPTA